MLTHRIIKIYLVFHLFMARENSINAPKWWINNTLPSNCSKEELTLTEISNYLATRSVQATIISSISGEGTEDVTNRVKTYHGLNYFNFHIEILHQRANTKTEQQRIAQTVTFVLEFIIDVFRCTSTKSSNSSSTLIHWYRFPNGG